MCIRDSYKHVKCLKLYTVCLSSAHKNTCPSVQLAVALPTTCFFTLTWQLLMNCHQGRWHSLGPPHHHHHHSDPQTLATSSAENRGVLMATCLASLHFNERIINFYNTPILDNSLTLKHCVQHLQCPYEYGVRENERDSQKIRVVFSANGLTTSGVVF